MSENKNTEIELKDDLKNEKQIRDEIEIKAYENFLSDIPFTKFLFAATAILFFLLSGLVIGSVCYCMSITFEKGETLKTNWGLSPIKSLNIKDSPCELALGEEIAFDESWEGTNEGCYCPENFYDSLLVGNCDDNDIVINLKDDDPNDCYNIEKIDPIPIKKWGGKYICLKRFDKSYLSYNSVVEASMCTGDLKPCGIIDSYNRILCVSSAEDCPINKIVFSNQNESLPNDFNYKTINLSNGGKISYTNEDVINGKIPIEFSINEGLPCKNKEIYNTNRNVYELEKINKKTNCVDDENEENSTIKIHDFLEFYDDSYNLISTQNYREFLQQNNIEEKISDLPGFNSKDNENSTISLFTKGYTKVNDKCFNYLKVNEGNFNASLVKRKEKIENLLSIEHGIFLSVFISFIFFGYLYFEYYDKTLKDEIEIKEVLSKKLTFDKFLANRVSRLNVKYLIYAGGLFALSVLANLVLFIIFFIKEGNVKDTFIISKSDSCLYEDIVENKNVFNELNHLKKINTVGIIISILTLILSITRVIVDLKMNYEKLKDFLKINPNK